MAIRMDLSREAIIRRIGRCCQCFEPVGGEPVYFILLKFAWWKYPSWTNPRNGIDDGAIAILCGDCGGSDDIRPEAAVEVTDDGVVIYHPIAQLANILDSEYEITGETPVSHSVAY